MTNQLSFKRDFAYKFIESTSFINSHETPRILLPLWRSNRLSLIRSYIFLENFFKDVTLRKKTTLSIKYKRSDKKTHKKTIYFIQILLKNTDFFVFLLTYLPEPKLVGTTTGYMLVYPYYHFVITIAFTELQPVFVYKMIPYLKLFPNA